MPQLISSPTMLTVSLIDGRVISADLIWATLTYSGLIEGRPDEDFNSGIVASISNFAERNYHQKAVIIPPTITSRSNGERVWPELPTVKVVAHFTSDIPVKDADAFGSMLVIGWFQDKVEPLISLDVRPMIEAVEWALHAEDWSL